MRNKRAVRKAIVIAAGAVVLGLGGMNTAFASTDGAGSVPAPAPTVPGQPTIPGEGLECSIPQLPGVPGGVVPIPAPAPGVPGGQPGTPVPAPVPGDVIPIPSPAPGVPGGQPGTPVPAPAPTVPGQPTIPGEGLECSIPELPTVPGQPGIPMDDPAGSVPADGAAKQ